MLLKRKSFIKKLFASYKREEFQEIGKMVRQQGLRTTAIGHSWLHLVAHYLLFKKNQQEKNDLAAWLAMRRQPLVGLVGGVVSARRGGNR